MGYIWEVNKSLSVYIYLYLQAVSAPGSSLLGEGGEVIYLGRKDGSQITWVHSSSQVFSQLLPEADYMLLREGKFGLVVHLLLKCGHYILCMECGLCMHSTLLMHTPG